MTDQTPPPAGWERCVDCVPFQQMAERVARVEDKVAALADDAYQIKVKLTDLRHQFDLFRPVGDDIRKVLHLLEGNGDPKKGIVYRVLTLETDYVKKGVWLSRLGWLVSGILVTGFLTALGVALLDLAKRGLLG